MRKLVIFDVNNVLCKRTSTKNDMYECVKGEKYSYLMKPNIKCFLRLCNEKYDIALWTSGKESEMKNVIDYLSVIDYKFIWYANMCDKSLKDANKVTGYDDFLIVDDDEYKTRTFDKRIILSKMNINNNEDYYELEYVSLFNEINNLL